MYILTILTAHDLPNSAHVCNYSTLLIVLFCPTGKPDKPGVPQIMAVNKTKISLSWEAPRSDGGSPIFNYCVDCREEGLFKWTRANADNVAETKFTVKGLKENTVYEFRVAAENKAGTGAYSEATSPVKAEEIVGEFSEQTGWRVDSEEFASRECNIVYSPLCNLPLETQKRRTLSILFDHISVWNSASHLNSHYDSYHQIVYTRYMYFKIYNAIQY